MSDDLRTLLSTLLPTENVLLIVDALNSFGITTGTPGVPS